jgi:hypothetical protein
LTLAGITSKDALRTSSTFLRNKKNSIEYPLGGLLNF